jgi:hypothetical protein
MSQKAKTDEELDRDAERIAQILFESGESGFDQFGVLLGKVADMLSFKGQHYKANLFLRASEEYKR